MAFVVADRVFETSTSSGTGILTLDGAIDNSFRTFESGIGNGNTTFYCAQSPTQWEVGIGTVSVGTGSGGRDQLARTTVIDGSNGNSLVSFTAGGTLNVFCTIPGVGLPYIRNTSGNAQVKTDSDNRVRIETGGVTRAVISADGITHTGSLVFDGTNISFWGAGTNDLNGDKWYERIFDVSPGVYLFSLAGRYFITSSIQPTEAGLLVTLGTTTAGVGTFKNQDTVQPGTTILSRIVGGWAQVNPTNLNINGGYGFGSGFGFISLNAPITGLVYVQSNNLSVGFHSQWGSGFLRMSEGDMRVSIIRLTADQT